MDFGLWIIPVRTDPQSDRAANQRIWCVAYMNEAVCTNALQHTTQVASAICRSDVWCGMSEDVLRHMSDLHIANASSVVCCCVVRHVRGCVASHV